MDLQEIVKQWLSTHGYDGLFNPDDECGCMHENIMPCGNPLPCCEPGYQQPEPSGKWDFIVGPRKEEPHGD
jgi:hypothetical protein